MADVLRDLGTYREPMRDPATSTALTARPQPVLAGEELHLLAFVAAADGRTAAGTVTLRDGSLTLGTAPLRNGRASLKVRLFSSGPHTLHAAYEGLEPSHATCVITVLEPVSVLLSAAVDGHALALTARVHGRWDAPPCTGSVLFECDGTPLGSGEIEAGMATISRALAPGAHSLTATYPGDGRYAGARSEPLEIFCRVEGYAG